MTMFRGNIELDETWFIIFLFINQRNPLIFGNKIYSNIHDV